MRRNGANQTGVGLGISMGAAVGVLGGISLGGDWLAICIAMGAGLGVAFGAAWDSTHGHHRP